MSDNDHITRGEARKLAYKIFSRFMFAPFLIVPPEEIDEMVDTIPAVTQEMSVKELLLTEARMIYADEYAYAEYSRLVWNVKLNEAAAFAEKWSREHPKEANNER